MGKLLSNPLCIWITWTWSLGFSSEGSRIWGLNRGFSASSSFRSSRFFLEKPEAIFSNKFTVQRYRPWRRECLTSRRHRPWIGWVKYFWVPRQQDVRARAVPMLKKMQATQSWGLVACGNPDRNRGISLENRGLVEFDGIALASQDWSICTSVWTFSSVT